MSDIEGRNGCEATAGLSKAAREAVTEPGGEGISIMKDEPARALPPAVAHLVLVRRQNHDYTSMQHRSDG